MINYLVVGLKFYCQMSNGKLKATTESQRGYYSGGKYNGTRALKEVECHPGIVVNITSAITLSRKDRQGWAHPEFQ